LRSIPSRVHRTAGTPHSNSPSMPQVSSSPPWKSPVGGDSRGWRQPPVAIFSATSYVTSKSILPESTSVVLFPRSTTRLLSFGSRVTFSWCELARLQLPLWVALVFPDIHMVPPFDLQTIFRLNNCHFSLASVTLFMTLSRLLTGQWHQCRSASGPCLRVNQLRNGPSRRSYLPTSPVKGGMQREHLTEMRAGHLVTQAGVAVDRDAADFYAEFVRVLS
jgi:hypothetical protein